MSSFSLDVQAYNHKHYETNTYGILGKRGCGGCIWETVVTLRRDDKNNRPSLAVRALAAAVGAEAANATFTEARTTDGLLSICAGAQDRPLMVW